MSAILAKLRTSHVKARVCICLSHPVCTEPVGGCSVILTLTARLRAQSSTRPHASDRVSQSLPQALGHPNFGPTVYKFRASRYPLGSVIHCHDSQDTKSAVLMITILLQKTQSRTRQVKACVGQGVGGPQKQSFLVRRMDLLGT